MAPPTIGSLPPMAQKVHFGAPVSSAVNVPTPGFAQQSAVVKQQALWNAIQAAPYTTLPALNSAGIDGGSKFSQIVTLGAMLNPLYAYLKLSPIFTTTTDTVQRTDYKFVHPFGVACKVSFIADPTSHYSGVFKTGAPGIARLSLAHDPANGFIPGLALKLLVDGKETAALPAINNLEGQSDNNFFTPTLSTTIPAANQVSTIIVAAIFAAGKLGNPDTLSPAALAEVNPDGTLVDQVAAPAEVSFVPTAAVANLAPGKTDFRTELSAIPAGTPLYEVVGTNADGSTSHIGTVVSESKMVASQFEDQNLFFQHGR